MSDYFLGIRILIGIILTMMVWIICFHEIGHIIYLKSYKIPFKFGVMVEKKLSKHQEKLCCLMGIIAGSIGLIVFWKIASAYGFWYVGPILVSFYIYGCRSDIEKLTK